MVQFFLLTVYILRRLRQYYAYTLLEDYDFTLLDVSAVQ